MNIKEMPDWSGRLLQGLSYWVAYKNVLYPGYPLREAALIAEATTLLYTNKDKYSINCEIMYKNLQGLQKHTFESKNEENEFLKFKNSLGEKRVDLIINSKENENIEEYLIEVKRKLDDDKVVEENEIDKDIDRLAEYLKYTTNKNARCFVLVVSQNDIPRKFVNDSFRAQKANSRDDFFTTERNNKYRVRMVRKAIPNLEEKEKYHQDRIERHSEEDDDNTYFNVKTVFSILLEVFV
jgi:hypothetical protein